MIPSHLLKYFSLSILTLQATIGVLAMRCSRNQQNDDKELYIVTTTVLVSECIKFTCCIGLLYYQKSWSCQRFGKTFLSQVIYKPRETVKMAIPSSLFALQSNLILLALSSLDAATFQVTYQLKILTTALFSVLILRKTLKIVQWLSLVVLTCGVVLIQLPSQTDQNSIVESDQTIGMVAVMISAISSGFAGVYHERLLKGNAQPSLIIRNIQLGMFSIPFCIGGVIINDWQEVTRRGFFDGYNPVVWLVIFLHTTGGLAVAAVTKYADSILKGFASSVSIVLSCLCSHVMFHDLELNFSFGLGTALVIGATIIYGTQSRDLIVNVQSNNLIHRC